MRIPATLFVCAGFAALALPVTASAIDPGVNYDPGSPAGKEYAIPLAEGRSEGAGTANHQAGADVPFGVGITPPGRASGRRAQGEHGGGGRAGVRGERRALRDGESAEELTARIRAAETPAGTAGPTALLALAVLLPAGLLALILRGRPQTSRTGRAA